MPRSFVVPSIDEGDGVCAGASVAFDMGKGLFLALLLLFFNEARVRVTSSCSSFSSSIIGADRMGVLEAEGSMRGVAGPNDGVVSVEMEALAGPLLLAAVSPLALSVARWSCRA